MRIKSTLGRRLKDCLLFTTRTPQPVPLYLLLKTPRMFKSQVLELRELSSINISPSHYEAFEIPIIQHTLTEMQKLDNNRELFQSPHGALLKEFHQCFKKLKYSDQLHLVDRLEYYITQMKMTENCEKDRDFFEQNGRKYLKRFLEKLNVDGNVQRNMDKICFFDQKIVDLLKSCILPREKISMVQRLKAQEEQDDLLCSLDQFESKHNDFQVVKQEKGQNEQMLNYQKSTEVITVGEVKEPQQTNWILLDGLPYDYKESKFQKNMRRILKNVGEVDQFLFFSGKEFNMRPKESY